MIISEKICAILDSIGMNQKELSKRAKIPYSTLHGYLKNGHSIPAEAVIKIAKALGVSVSTIMSEERIVVDHTEFTRSEREMITIYRKLNKEQQDFIFQSVQLLHEKNRP